MMQHPEEPKSFQWPLIGVRECGPRLIPKGRAATLYIHLHLKLHIWEDIVNKESASETVQLCDANVVDLKESDII
jgi:hypothetical protein